MKTLQQLLQTTTIEAIYAVTGRPVTDEAKAFYREMTTMEGVNTDPSYVFFAAAYLRWDMMNKTPDFAASIYDARDDEVVSIMFIRRQELLGYLVSDMSIQVYGKEAVLGAILEEITFFGYDEQATIEEKEALVIAASDIEESALVPFSEVLAEMGIDPKELELTPEEESYNNRALQKNAAIRDNQIAAIRAQLAQL